MAGGIAVYGLQMAVDSDAQKVCYRLREVSETSYNRTPQT
jgi:hypothetical protein